jgi:hypothetical protein
MGKYSKKRLPKGFRYLFTSKEVKEIEEKSELNFNWVSNGNVGNSEKFNTENTIQSNFRAFSIHSKKNEGNWILFISIYLELSILKNKKTISI